MGTKSNAKRETEAYLKHELQQATLANRRLARAFIENKRDCADCPCWDNKTCEYSRTCAGSHWSRFPLPDDCVESLLNWAYGGWQNRRRR